MFGIVGDRGNEGDITSAEKEKGDEVQHKKKTRRLSNVRRLSRRVSSATSILWSALILLWPTVAMEHMKPGRKLRKTAYLDGMRGVAAFMVYWTHHELWAHDTTADGSIGHIFEDGFGHKGIYVFVALPFVRVFFSAGHYAVALFFVISGRSLSSKPLALVQAGQESEFLANVSAALFKRAMRLFIPFVVVTYVYILCMWLFGLDGFPDREPTFAIEMRRLFKDTMDFIFLFPTVAQGGFRYNVFAWSIPVEFRGSFVVYTTLVALCRLRVNARLSIYLLLIWYFLYMVDGWAYALFVSGMLLCELELLAEKGATPRFLLQFKSRSTLIFSALFVFSLYVGGMPYHNDKIKHLRSHWGWYYVSFLKPAANKDYKWFFMYWASVSMVAAVPHISWLKAFFETRFCQYLGEVSYGFYLVHGPILWTIGNRLFVMVGFARDSHERQLYSWLNEFPLPRGRPLGLNPAFLVTQIILLPLTLWVAELITKVVDKPSVRLPQRLYHSLLQPRTVESLL